MTSESDAKIYAILMVAHWAMGCAAFLIAILAQSLIGAVIGTACWIVAGLVFLGSAIMDAA